jgi:hypothetical protein
MKTTLNNLTDQSSTNLFRKLFELRLELEDSTDQRLNSRQDEVAQIIECIDHLLQSVMDDLSQ